MLEVCNYKKGANYKNGKEIKNANYDQVLVCVKNAICPFRAREIVSDVWSNV